MLAAAGVLSADDAANPYSGRLRQITSDTEIKVPCPNRRAFQCFAFRYHCKPTVAAACLLSKRLSLINCGVQVTLQVPGWMLISENVISRTGSMVSQHNIVKRNL